MLGDSVIEEYYKATYYRGYQMQIANYYYVYEKDCNGVAVRYTNEEFKQVAYISQTVIDGLDAAEREKYVSVPNEGEYYKKYGARYGDSILLYRDGDTEVVAYDKENGVINYTYDPNTKEHVIEKYTEAEMQARYERALQIAAECVDNEAKFVQYANEFSDNSDFNSTYAPNGMYFAVGTMTTDSVFGSFSAELAKLEVGGTSVVSSDSGYYILMRVELDAGAWKNQANQRWFTTLRGLALEYMLQKKTTPYLDRVEIDEELLATVDITMVSTNLRY